MPVAVDPTQLVAAALVLLRLATATMMAMSSSLLAGVPLRLRVGAAIAFASLLVPLVPNAHVSVTRADLPMLALGEVLCGALFGFGIQLWLVGADVCTQLFGQTSGLGMMVFARSSESAPLARFLRLLWVCIFFLAGGHRRAVACLLESFQATPLGQLTYDTQTFSSTVDLLLVSLGLGIQAGLPVVAALLLTSLVSLLLGRMIPQIHIMATSTGLGALVLVTALWIGGGPLFRTLEHQVGIFLSVLSQLPN